jgi:uncharacterized membrane protein (DUF485 family)
MNCPKCQLKMPFQERICRRCQYCVDLDRYVSTDAPRAIRRRLQRKPLRHVAMQALYPKMLSYERRISPWVILVASIVPGIGHALLRRLPEALFFVVLVPSLALAALFSPVDATASLALLGLGFGLHVASIFRITSTSMHLGMSSRLGMHLALFALLAVFIYSPLGNLVLTYKPELTYQRSVPMEDINSGLLLAVGIFITSWALSGVVSLLLSRSEKRT